VGCWTPGLFEPGQIPLPDDVLGLPYVVWFIRSPLGFLRPFQIKPLFFFA
jgi:hypothetical protein